MGYPNIDGSADQDIGFAGGDIGRIDGSGTRVITGEGQDLTIHDRKDGDGSTTLQNFGAVVIVGEKNGSGKLTLVNCASFQCKRMDGAGALVLDFAGAKTIDDKNGDGWVYYTGAKPNVGTVNGNGKIQKKG